MVVFEEISYAKTAIPERTLIRFFHGPPSRHKAKDIAGLPGRTTLLVLFAAAARTEIIAARLCRCSAESRRRRPLAGYQSRKWCAAIQEETLHSGAEIVETRFPVRRSNEPVLGTAAVTHSQRFAFQTEAREGVPLCRAEISLRLALQQLAERRLPDIAQPVLGVDKMVARKEIAVLFEHRNLTAGFTENTQ